MQVFFSKNISVVCYRVAPLLCVCVCVKSPFLATRLRAVRFAHTGKTRTYPSIRSLIGPLCLIRPLNFLCVPSSAARPVNGALFSRSLSPHRGRTYSSVGRKGERVRGRGKTVHSPLWGWGGCCRFEVTVW